MPIKKLSKPQNQKSFISRSSSLSRTSTHQPLILIDGSYFCFWRYTATKAWWGHSKQGTTDDCQVSHVVFLEKFTKHFKDSIAKMQKLFNSNQFIWCRDAPQEDLWRMPLHEEYKAGRTSTDHVGPFIKYSYDQLIPTDQVVRAPRAEADDILATICLYEQKLHPQRRIVIVSGDTDFLQLVTEDRLVQVVDPKKKFQPILLPTQTPTAESYLLAKILMGDKSDNIPQVPKCGPKTAQRLAHDPIALEQEVMSDPERQAQFLKNQQLIDFKEIPTELNQQIVHQYRILTNPYLRLTLKRRENK